MASESSDSEGYISEDDHDVLLVDKRKFQGKDVFDDQIDSEEEDSEVDTAGQVSKSRKKASAHELEENPKPVSSEDIKQEKLERLKKLRASKKSKHKTGVVYLSKIPPYMKPAKMRQILSRFGEVDRLFLKREDEQRHKNRVKGGGNKKVMFEEGWAEFVRKKDAKLCASTLNGNILGGKKGSFYHDDVMNVKYLSGFKWADLTEQIARENDVRQAKLQLEVSQANKMNAEFIRNIEKSKMLNNIRSKKRSNVSEATSNENSDSQPAPAHFKQRKVTTNRASGPEHLKKASSGRLEGVIKNLL
ncbi:RNA-binding ATPase activator ESF2 [Lachancea thermotolerans CBS 6340]|uniref:Pre-rRNA-processing protein ESF2 n=1 Tax=Lachancea thermotolerans (strain ATCC 56472 / CBS 6340 / NRRL Y-8284) TaxID=559295 RepID=C5DC45_LACTC|nr:KLTH0A07700p [Lachancea thermotolerans CBS 6340]CAR21352.1 KLTH0A07700p [Lachancea thermotolerans CBS 6340]